MLRPTHQYIGKCRGCSVILASAYDMADYPKGTAESLTRMVKDGLAIERVPLGSVELGNMRCTCPPPQETDGLPLFTQAGG